jgi:hypothetical protein
MELEDFAFFLFAPILLGPLLAIYGALRVLKWSSRGSLFLDAWLIWLARFASSIVGLLGSLYLAERPLMFPQLSTYWEIVVSLIPIIAANLGVISFVSWLLKRRLESEGINLFDEKPESNAGRQPVFQAALATTVAAIIGFIVSVSAAGGIATVYDHYNPPPPPPSGFQIYDI